MPSTEMKWLLLFLVVFFAVNIVLLRLSCRLANYVNRWSPQSTPLKIPNYWSCLAIALGVVVIMGLIGNASELLIASWAANFFPKWTWSLIVNLAEVALVIKLIAWGLSGEQPAPTRLVTLASLLHVCLVFGLCVGSGQAFASLVINR